MVFYKQLSTDQTENLETAIAVTQLVANLSSAIFRGDTSNTRRYVQSAKGQLDKISDKISATTQAEIEPIPIRSVAQLADISLAQWSSMPLREKLAVLIEHFVNGSVYDPLACGFCQDLPEVLSTLKLDGAP